MTATATKKNRSTGTRLFLSTFKTALSTVLQAVPSKQVKPILTNVLLGDGVIIGTDLEIQVTTEIDYHGHAVLLPAKRLAAILNNATGEEVALAPDGSACTVSSGRGSWKLPTEDATEYPRWEPSDLQPVCRLPADQFVRAGNATVYATDSDSSRYALGAVLVEVLDGVVSFVGTDGRRLSVYEAEIDQSVEDCKVLIPARAMSVMSRVASLSEGSVQLERSRKEVVATCDSTTVTARLMDGAFPRWRDTLQLDRESKATRLIASDLLSATNAAAICTSETSKGVKYTFTKDGIHLVGHSSEFGESSVTCPLEEFGNAATVTLDPRFVADFIKNLDDLSVPVEVDAIDSISAVVFRCDDATGVVMPLSTD